MYALFKSFNYDPTSPLATPPELFDAFPKLPEDELIFFTDLQIAIQYTQQQNPELAHKLIPIFEISVTDQVKRIPLTPCQVMGLPETMALKIRLKDITWVHRIIVPNKGNMAEYDAFGIPRRNNFPAEFIRYSKHSHLYQETLNARILPDQRHPPSYLPVLLEDLKIRAKQFIKWLKAGVLHFGQAPEQYIKSYLVMGILLHLAGVPYALLFCGTISALFILKNKYTQHQLQLIAPAVLIINPIGIADQEKSKGLLPKFECSAELPASKEEPSIPRKKAQRNLMAEFG